jgi:flagellar biosynthetic protein FliR
MGGVMVFAPLFGSRSIPAQVKAALALVATTAMLSGVPLEAIPDASGPEGLLLLAGGQFVAGMALGLVAAFVFAGMQLAGQIISFQLGFSINNLVDPQSEVEMAVFSFMNNFLGLLFFLLLNGHHWFFQAVGGTYHLLPVQGIVLRGPLVQEVVRLSSGMLSAGLQIAGPILAVTVLTDIVLGMLGRVAPQIQVLIVGLPLKLLVGFSCLSISFYFLPRWLSGAFADLQRSLFGLVRGLS